MAQIFVGQDFANFLLRSLATDPMSSNQQAVRSWMCRNPGLEVDARFGTLLFKGQA